MAQRRPPELVQMESVEFKKGDNYGDFINRCRQIFAPERFCLGCRNISLDCSCEGVEKIRVLPFEVNNRFDARREFFLVHLSTQQREVHDPSVEYHEITLVLKRSSLYILALKNDESVWYFEDPDINVDVINEIYSDAFSKEMISFSPTYRLLASNSREKDRGIRLSMDVFMSSIEAVARITVDDASRLYRIIAKSTMVFCQFLSESMRCGEFSQRIAGNLELGYKPEGYDHDCHGNWDKMSWEIQTPHDRQYKVDFKLGGLDVTVGELIGIIQLMKRKKEGDQNLKKVSNKRGGPRAGGGRTWRPRPVRG